MDSGVPLDFSYGHPPRGVWLSAVGNTRVAMAPYTLPPDETAPARARNVVRSQLMDDLNAAQLEAARLAISEIVTNALQHGNLSADGATGVDLQRLDGHVRVTVSGSGAAFEVPENFPPPGQGHGYGLRLVTAVSDRWGVDANTGSVWFELDLHPDD